MSLERIAPCEECQHKIISLTGRVFVKLRPYNKKRSRGCFAWLRRLLGVGIYEEDWIAVQSMLIEINQQVESKWREKNESKQIAP